MQQAHPNNFWDTPEARAALVAADKYLHAKLGNPDTRPGDLIRAYSDHWQERYVKTGLEGMAGPDATYHFEHDYPALLGAAAYALTDDRLYPTARAKVRAIMGALPKAVGRRWERGIVGILCRLRGPQASAQRAELMAESIEFVQRISSLLGAADAVYREGAWGAALNTSHVALGVAIDEGKRVADWLESVGDLSVADGLQRGLQSAQDATAAYEAQQAQGQRSQRTRGAGRGLWGS